MASKIHADYVAILLKAANADFPVRDLSVLTELMKVCQSGDLPRLEEFAKHPNPRIGGEARYILREHKFNFARLFSAA